MMEYQKRILFVFSIFIPVFLYSPIHVVHAATTLVAQNDGSVTSTVSSGCNNGCTNVNFGSQIFHVQSFGNLDSLTLFSSNYRTDSRNANSNTCIVTIYNNDTGDFLGVSDKPHPADGESGAYAYRGSDCGSAPQIWTFKNASIDLIPGVPYRWDFIMEGQNFSSLTWLGSLHDTVGGAFSVSPIMNAKFIALAALPVPAPLGQFKSDGATLIPEGSITQDQTVIFTGAVPFSSPESLQLQIEIRPKGIAFTGQDDGGMASSSLIVPGIRATIARTLPDGFWHWRARFGDASGNFSAWQKFGALDAADLIVRTAPPIADPTILTEQDNGSVMGHTSIGCNNACGNVTAAVQGFVPMRSGNLLSIELFTSRFITDSSNPYSNTCHIRLYDQDTNVFIAEADNDFEGPLCAGDIIFEFNAISPHLQAGTHYRWDFYWGGQNYSQLDFFGSPNNVVDGVFVPTRASWDRAPNVAVNAKFIVRASIPSISLGSLAQFKSDATSTISEGGTTTEDAIVFSAALQSSSTNQLLLEAEYTTSTFMGVANATSSPVRPGSVATTTATGLQDGNYRWRARAMDTITNTASDWQEFGTAGNVDFIVESLGQAAANLAKQLIHSDYLYGGKGWDYNLSEFVAPTTVRTGYNFWNQALLGKDFGAGVDCSGLIMWAYDRSFDSTKSRFNNFVKAEGANEQYRYNTTSTMESKLKPGDVMFFDFTSTDGPNYIDHVAMYVGESGGFDVINASSPGRGIVSTSKDVLKQLSGFRDFKQVISAVPFGMLASTYSPVDLIVTDPDGFTINPTTVVSSSEEYLRDIPDVLYYSEMERGADGNPIDRVYSYITKTGDYIVRVLPASGTLPTATYTLDFFVGDQSTTLAKNAPISQIPSQGYGVIMSATGTIVSFIPVAIDIKPGSYPNSINLKSNGVVPVAILGSAIFNVKQIDLTTIKLANASVKLKGNSQPMVGYSDINGDLFVDAVVQVPTQALQLTASDVKANLEGQLINGTIIKGSDSVRIVP